MHIGLPGVAYAFVTALLGLGAVNSQNNLLFWAFGVAIAGLMISGVVSGMMLLRIDAAREFVDTGEVGAPLHVRYTLRNRAWFAPAFALIVEEVAPRSRRRASWARLMPTPRAYVPYVRSGGSARADGATRPVRRGVATLHAFRVVSSFPFGIVRKSVVFEPRDRRPVRVLVRPEVRPVRPNVIRRAAAASAEGAVSTDSIGRGDEFFGLREYAPGDSPRRIAWRPSARTGQLVVREYVAPSPSRLWIGLTLDPRAPDDLRERAISVAASLLVAAEREGIEVGLSVPDRAVRIEPRTGLRHVGLMLDALAALDEPLAPDARTSNRHEGRAAWLIVEAGSSREFVSPRGATHIDASRTDDVFTPRRDQPSSDAKRSPARTMRARAGAKGAATTGAAR